MHPLVISARAEKRIKAGQLWIYSNEVDTKKTPLSGFESGQQVVLQNVAQKVLAYALINPKSLICARIVSTQHPLSATLIKQRLLDAYALRQACYKRPFYRLFYAEADFLPGLIIDRFGDYCVAQITNEGLLPFQQAIADVLIKKVAIKGVLFRQDMQSRALEGMDISTESEIIGEMPEQLVVEENGCEFIIPADGGQKTGWFYDHRDNRAKIAELSKGKRVLDVFSYIGAWGLACLKQGATELVSIDSSKSAMDFQAQSAARNGFSDQFHGLTTDAFKGLSALLEAKEKFDIVILDPPAFIKKKKDQRPGEHAYKKFNEAGLRLLTPGGFLVSASCSMHLEHSTLQSIVQGRARHVDRKVRLCYKGGHPFDHPVHPAIKETEYLKAQIYQVTR